MLRTLISNFEEAVCAAIFFAMTLLGFANVVVRYLTAQSLAATEELLINGFLLLTVFGAAIAAKRGDHLAVTVVYDLLPRSGRIPLVVGSTALSVLLLAAAAWYTGELVANQLASGMTSYALQLPAWYYTIAVPFGFIMVMLRLIQHAVAVVRALRAESPLGAEGGGGHV